MILSWKIWSGVQIGGIRADQARVAAEWLWGERYCQLPLAGNLLRLCS